MIILPEDLIKNIELKNYNGGERISKNKDKEPYTKLAPNLRDKKPVFKEYLGKDGQTYLVIGDFSVAGDKSGLVMRKKKSEDKISIAEYEFIEQRKQKNALEKINPDLGDRDHTYDQIEELLKDDIESD